eukprot:COSAG06_NODE_45_length_29559_cov_23.840835_11_plen_290_part_00
MLTSRTAMLIARRTAMGACLLVFVLLFALLVMQNDIAVHHEELALAGTHDEAHDQETAHLRATIELLQRGQSQEEEHLRATIEQLQRGQSRGHEIPAAMCGMTWWWGGTQLIGEEVADQSVEKHAGTCCSRCEAIGAACTGWTYNTEDHYCHVLRTVEETRRSDEATSGRAAGEPMQAENEDAFTDGSGDIAFAADVMREALSTGRASARGSAPEWDATDIVMVSAWRRPEFLLHTLSNLLRAEGADSHFVLFLLDLHASPTVLAIAEACPIAHLVLQLPPHFFFKGGW